MSRALIGTLIATLLTAGGCVVRERHHAHTRPDLVAVSPGVHVIADYDEPIFYTGGYYWWQVDGYWYRSSRYTDGWVVVAAPPRALVRIHDPHRYRHYRPHGYVERRRPVPARTIERPAVRDHRDRRRPR